MAKNSLALPDHVVQLLAAADASHGFPAGTMFSVMQQESGGQDRFLSDPSTYHYPTDASGKRKSSAFGPLGILDSTAADPGYGVKPLGDRADVGEHIRFSADYLAARAKQAGSLAAGLAGYGEGGRYANEVLARVNAKVPAGAPAPTQEAPVVAAAQPASQITQPGVVADAPVAVNPNQTPLMPAPADPEKDPWLNFQQRFQAAGLVPKDLTYGSATPAKVAPVTIPGAMRPEDVASLYDIQVGNQPNFRILQGLGLLHRRPS